MGTLGWPLLFLVVALCLLIAEVFIPSGGLIGAAAAFCLGYSLWLAFRHSYASGMRFLAADVFLLPMALMLAMYLWPKTPLAKRVFLKPPGPEEIEVSHAAERLDHLIGQIGRVLTPLRPSGRVDFDGRPLDAVSEGGLIDSGTLVRAIRVRSGRLVVRTATTPDLDETLSLNNE